MHITYDKATFIQHYYSKSMNLCGPSTPSHPSPLIFKWCALIAVEIDCICGGGSPQKLGLLTLLALDNKWVATVKVLHQIIYLFISSFLLLICFFLVFSSRSWSLHIMGLASIPSSLSPFSMPLPSWLLALVSPGGSTPKN